MHNLLFIYEIIKIKFRQMIKNVSSRDFIVQTRRALGPTRRAMVWVWQLLKPWQIAVAILFVSKASRQMARNLY